MIKLWMMSNSPISIWEVETKLMKKKSNVNSFSVLINFQKNIPLNTLLSVLMIYYHLKEQKYIYMWANANLKIQKSLSSHGSCITFIMKMKRKKRNHSYIWLMITVKKLKKDSSHQKKINKAVNTSFLKEKKMIMIVLKYWNVFQLVSDILIKSMMMHHSKLHHVEK